MPIKYISSPQNENLKLYSTPTRPSAFAVVIWYIRMIPLFLNKPFYVLCIYLTCVILTCTKGGPQNVELIFLRQSMTAVTSNFNMKYARSRRVGIYFKIFNLGTWSLFYRQFCEISTSTNDEKNRKSDVVSLTSWSISRLSKIAWRWNCG